MKSIFGAVILLMAINSTAQAQGTTNTEIVRLRAEYQDLARRAAEVEARVGPNHLVVVKIRERMDYLYKQIQEEERRIEEDEARTKEKPPL
jgi:polysaccharide biosynthesis transport protein